jgi:hypothetical protein
MITLNSRCLLMAKFDFVLFCVFFFFLFVPFLLFLFSV